MTDLLAALADLNYLDGADTQLREMHDRILGKGVHLNGDISPLDAADYLGSALRDEVHMQIGREMVAKHTSKIREAAVKR